MHFGPPHRPLAAAGVLALVAARRPDLVVISGDLTQRGKPAHFVEARAFVDSLGAPTLAVPGNHDVPLYRVWERMFSPYTAYQRHFAKELEPVFREPRMVVAGINTAFNWTLKNGCVRLRRLAEVQDLMAGVSEETLKVVVAHHPLVRLPGFPGDLPATNSRGTLEVLAGVGVDLVLGGHLHQGFVGRSEEFHAAPGVVLAYAGTSSSSRGRGGERDECSCNWIEWDERTLDVTRLRWRPGEPGFEEVEWSRFVRAPAARLVSAAAAVGGGHLS